MYNEIIEIAKAHGAELVILFGSRAKGKEREQSDIDICIVADTDNKRRLAATISEEIQNELPVDVLVYTSSEWADCIKDRTSFASKILNEGKILYGQQTIS